MRGNCYRVLAAVALLGLTACGGSGGSSKRTPTPGTGTPTSTSTPGTPTSPSTPGTPTSGTPTSTPTPTPRGTLPPTRTPGGGPSILPDICNIGRVVFRSQTGESCCIAADPVLLPPKPIPGQPNLVLTNLPLGPATVTIDGYVENFAPLPPDVTATCETVNTSGVRPCDTVDASAAYGSEPKAITIFGGVRVNLGDVVVSALPFLLDVKPPQNDTVEVPVGMGFTVVDAETGIAAPSVALDITLNAPQGQPPVFRPLTKRVPLQLDPCKDGTAHKCSREDNLGATGFIANAVAEYLSYLPDGPVDVRITAKNLAEPPRDLDFQYRFFVGAQPAPTPTQPASQSGAAAAGVLIIPTATPTPTPVTP